LRLLAAHNGKQPRTIYTDQDAAMAKAIPKVFTESYHELCTFHIMQNAVKYLSPVTDEKKKKKIHKKVKVKRKLKIKNLIFYLILVLVCMDMRTRQHFKKYLTS